MIPVDELDPIDFSLLLQRAKAQPEIAGRLISGFSDLFKPIGTDLRNELLAGNLEEAGYLARSLAKVAGMLGAARLEEAAHSLDALLSQGTKQEVNHAIACLEQAILPVIHAALRQQQGASDPVPQPAKAPAAKDQCCILVIDDQLSMRVLLEDILQGEYRTLLAADAGEGLQLAAQEIPDLILLDVDLPDMDGYMVLKHLKDEAATAGIPVMFVTGSTDISSESLGLHLGAVDYVTKPINPAILMARIKSQIKIKRAEAESRRRIQRDHYLELVAEFERSALLEETRQVQLKIKDDFLSHVSHELRAPAMSIYSFVTLVMDGIAGEVNPRQVEYLGIASRNVEHLQAMIEDLLEATRVGSGKLSIQTSDIFIGESIDYALKTVSPAAQRKSIQLASHYPADLPACRSDATRLRQTLTILLDNAVKFTPDGGSVTVNARIADQDAAYLLIEVADTGCGIGPDKVASVFDRLFQCADPGQQGRGLGLGLHIAKELVDRQGGKIWVDSVVGAGSTFRFTLPISVASPQEQPAGMPAA